MIPGPGLVLSLGSPFFCAARPSELCLSARPRPQGTRTGEVSLGENEQLCSPLEKDLGQSRLNASPFLSEAQASGHQANLQIWRRPWDVAFLLRRLPRESADSRSTRVFTQSSYSRHSACPPKPNLMSGPLNIRDSDREQSRFLWK